MTGANAVVSGAMRLISGPPLLISGLRLSSLSRTGAGTVLVGMGSVVVVVIDQ